MTTITKERLQWLANISGRDDIDDIDGGEIRELALIALASLEAEPVVYQYRLWDTEYDEWGEWEDCGECAFEGFVEEEKYQGAGVQTRKLYTVPQVSAVPDGLVKAVRFYEQVKHENPPVETGAWKDAVDWVLKEACQVAGIEVVSAPVASGIRIKGEN
ncbi:hypothetical protein, partial [Escherichia coli]|uniref:hypothetical protein n=1 Tax=Escherichia coli TaxID=562 RepID=UPI00207BCCA5